MQVALALVLALLAVPGAIVPTVSRAQSIETAPLAPPEPRLPGGIVVGPSNEMPPDDPSAADEGAVLVPVLPEDGDRTDNELDTAAIPTPGGDEAGSSRGAASGLGQGEIPREDLFKRAPGTGDLAPREPEPIPPIARVDAPGAVLRQLDKLTGRIETFELAVGEEVTVERLRIALGKCRVPEDGSTGNNIAFLQVQDMKNPDDAVVFSGWMFADSPALSAMDHPRFDLWLIQCKTSSAEAASESQ